MQAIRAEGLVKAYGSVLAVNGVSLAVGCGELVALLGLNGAGKSTLIKLLTCHTRPTAGEAWLMGKSILKEPEGVKRVIGVLPQETAVAPNLTVAENLGFMCGVHGLGAGGRREAMELAGRLGLSQVLKRRAGRLSGGWQRRLSLAMALVGRPEVLFLDEPTLGLDIIARSELWGVIRELRGNSTIVLTTHYLEEAEALADRIGILGGGRLLALGTAAGLKAQAGESRFEDAFIKLARGVEG